MLRSILILQSGLALVAMGLSVLLVGDKAGIAALYGSAVAITNTIMLGSRIIRASRMTESSPQKGMALIYLSAVMRFVFLLVALGLGMGYLKLEPAVLALSFVGTQSGYFLLTLKQKQSA